MTLVRILLGTVFLLLITTQDSLAWPAHTHTLQAYTTPVSFSVVNSARV